MAYVPGAALSLGSPLGADENSERTVTLEPFFIDVHPVTCAQYAEFVEAASHRPPKDWPDGHMPLERARHPVVWLTWPDAAAYAEWAAKRLPTEDEWEYAARGTDGRPYPWGSGFDAALCNCRASRIGGTTPVGHFPGDASPFGCRDMAGNVWEWTASPHPVRPDRRVLRGGSWGSSPMTVRACYRGHDLPGYWSNAYGVRCARSVGR